MRIIIIGAVAAGTSAAAKARRNSEEAQIVMYEKDDVISYSGCGMPYYLGGEIEDASELSPRDSAFFKSKYNVDIFVRHEVLAIHPDKKTIEVKNLISGNVFLDAYDKLIIATGASAFVPPLPGIAEENVFILRSISDMHKIKAFIDDASPKTAAIIGTGFIGLEMCESLCRLGIKVSMIENKPHISPLLDEDMAVHVQEVLIKNKVAVYADATIAKITKEGAILSDGTEIDAQLILIAAGVRPNTQLATHAGIEIGPAGAIKVNEAMQTNIEDIYACGDCCEQIHLITKESVYCPLGSTANKTGRIAGDCVTGGSLRFRGILGTGIFKIFDYTVARTGLGEQEATAHGYDVTICHNTKPNRPEYMGGKEMTIKAIANKADGRLLGVQIVGQDGVDKRIDVFATAITFGALAEDLFHLDLAYAPPFSTTKDPVMYTGMILDNALRQGRALITSAQLDMLREKGQTYHLVDARAPAQYEKGHIANAQNVPHDKLRSALLHMDKKEPTITYCNKGTTGNAAQNILLQNGFEKVYNLSGGHKQYTLWHKNKKKESV